MFLTANGTSLGQSCACDPFAGWEFTDPEIEAIKRYVYEGHGLIATAGTLYYYVPNNNKLASLFGLNETIQWDATWTDLLHLVDPTHPVMKNVPNPLVFRSVQSALPFDGRWDQNELVGGKYIAMGHYQESCIVTYKGLIYISPWLEIEPPYYHHHLQLLYNAITWSRYVKPEHELVVDLETPKHLKPGETVLLNATVYNMGLNNESNVELYLTIDEETKNYTIIPKLFVGENQKISYLWTPTVEKIYNVTAYSPPKPEEGYTFNNFVSVNLFVRFARYVLWDDTKDADDDSLTGNYMDLYNLLTENGFIIEELATGPITYQLLASYDILVLMDPELEFSNSEISDIQRWIELGGSMVCIPDGGYPPTLNTLLLPYGVQMTGQVGGYGSTTDILDHPITEGVNSIFVDWVREISTTPPSTTLAWITDYGERLAFLSTTDSGEVVVVSDSNIMDNYGLWVSDNAHLILNIFNWVGVKPEHDLTVGLEAPKTIKPGQTVTLNATVLNRGLNNETDIEFHLLINGEQVANKTIAFLQIGELETLNYSWTPLLEGTYNITAYAPPLPGEERTQNNAKSTKTIVTAMIVALFKNVDPWDFPSNQEALELYGISYIVFSSSDFGYVDLSEFTKVVIPSDQDQAFYDAMNEYRWWFEEYASQGGILEIHAACHGWNGGGWVGPLPGGLEWVSFYSDSVTIVDTAHPVVTDPNIITDEELDYWGYSVHGYLSNYPAESHIIIVEDSTGRPAYLEFEYGSGMILASSQTLEWAYRNHYSLILENSLLYMPKRYEHDLTVTLEAPEFLEIGNAATLRASVTNRGVNNETNIQLYLFVRSEKPDSNSRTSSQRIP